MQTKKRVPQQSEHKLRYHLQLWALWEVYINVRFWISWIDRPCECKLLTTSTYTNKYPCRRLSIIIIRLFDWYTSLGALFLFMCWEMAFRFGMWDVILFSSYFLTNVVFLALCSCFEHVRCYYGESGHLMRSKQTLMRLFMQIQEKVPLQQSLEMEREIFLQPAASSFHILQPHQWWKLSQWELNFNLLICWDSILWW